MKCSGRKDTLFYTTDDKQKGTPVKYTLITINNTSSNLKEKTPSNKRTVVRTTKHFTVFFFCSYLFYGTYFLAMLVGSVKNASLFQKFTLNSIGFRMCDLSEPLRCHSSLPVCLIET